MVATMSSQALFCSVSSRHLRAAIALAVAAVLAGCATALKPGATTAPKPPVAGAGGSERDGAEANPPADLARVPDAEPALEPIRLSGPNKPYEALGQAYVPITGDRPFAERGLASWYGRKFHGRRTASGEVYNMYAMTAAHPTLPIPSYARIRNPANGREVLVRVNDRGPFHGGRIVDLSYTAALKLDLLRGVAPVELQRITFDEIRSGAWRRERTNPGAPPATELAVAAEAEPPPVATLPGPTVDSAILPVGGLAPVAHAPDAGASTSSARGFWIQLGAFRAQAGAESFQRRVAAEMDWLAPLLAVFNDAVLYRLQAGPYPSRAEARGVAERVRDGLQLVPTIVERR